MKILISLFLALSLLTSSAQAAGVLKTPVKQCPHIAKAVVEHFKGLKQSKAIGFEAQKIVEFIVRSNPNLVGAPDSYIEQFGDMVKEACIQAKGETNIPKE